MLARPGTRGPSILHESTSKSAIRDPWDIPGRRIAARVDLEGSRGLESLPGALFFQGTCHFFPEKRVFCPEKTAGGIPREPQTEAWGRRQAGGGRRRQAIQGRRQAIQGRRQAGKGRRQAGAAPEAGGRREAKIRVFSKMSPEPPGGSGGFP